MILDADQRVALLALWVGGDRRSATDFLQASVIKKTASLEAWDESTERASGSQLADLYSQLRWQLSIAVLKAEIAAALAEVETRPSSSPRRRSVGNCSRS